MDSFSEIWQVAGDYIKTTLNVNNTAFNLWIAPLVPKSFDGKTAEFSYNSEYKFKIMKEKYDGDIKKALAAIIGFDDIEISYVYKPAGDTDDEANAENEKPAVSSISDNTSTFENFIVGSTNKFAYATALNAAENPGEEYNPLFIYGKSGLGKTHLLKAIKNRMLQNNPSANVLYTTSENFTNDLVYYLKLKNMGEFHNKYRNVDALLIDDIQFIANKTSTEEEFFHTFNALTEVNKQIVLTSDNPPDEIPTLQERLKNRFTWGMMADITPPDLETRMAIIKSKADYYNLDLPNNVVEFVAEQVKYNVRQIEGAVNKINALSTLNNKAPSIDIAKDAIKEILNFNQPISVTINRIIENVGNTFGISPENILSDKRDKNIKDARQASMFIIREITGMKLVDIGNIFGGKTHSTVNHSIEVIEDKMSANPTFKKTIEDIIKNIQEF